MKTPELLRGWIRLAALTCGWLFSLTALHAQATGTITGRVFNPATGEYVRNAEVRLQGTDRLVNTESDGTFVFDNVPSGQATIVVTYTGYQPATETVSVAAGQTATREINITSAAYGARTSDGTVQLEAFTVSSEREGNAKAIMAQKRNMNITTSVASDIFGDVSEGNVGEFLKFLPGVDVEYQDAETRGPRLGGLSPEYVGVTMDGAKMASADALGSYNGFINAPDAGRSMGFEQLSISSIESIEISRTISADMDADSPAGNINLKTKRGFDRKGRRIDWQFSLNAVSDDFKWGRTTRPGDRQNHLIRPSVKLDYSEALLNNRLGVSLSYSSSKILVEQQSVTHTYSRVATDARPLVLTGLSFGDGPKFIDRDTYSLNLDFKASSRLVLSMSSMFNTFSGATFSRSLSWTAATANANPNTGRTTVLGDGLTEIRTNGLATNTARAVGIGGGQNFDKKTKTMTFLPKFEYTFNKLLLDGGLTYSKSHNDYQSLPDSIRTHTVADLTGIDFRATRPHMNSADWRIEQTGGPDWSNLANFTNPRLQSNEDRGEIVKIYEAALNARYQLPFEAPTFIKIGGKLNEQYRTSYNRNGADQWSYIGPGGNVLLPNGTIQTTGSFANFVSPRIEATKRGPEIMLNVANMPRHPNRQELARAFIEHPEWFSYTATAAQYYDAFYGSHRDFKQAVPALYGMANTRLGKWQFQGGIRYEKTETTAKEYDPIPGAQMPPQFPVGANRRATTREGIDFQYGSRPRVKREGDYDDFFPSFSAKYSFTPNLQAQFGYSHAISRPPISALAGVWVINDTATPPTVNAPNANLLPERSDNYVARVAYYFEPVGSFTFLVQQNEIQDVRTAYRYTADEFGVDDPAYEGYEFISTINGEQLFRYRNMELGYSQQLSFLPGPMRSTHLNLSYSRSYANQRRPGLIPHKVTASVAWQYWRVNMRLSGIWQDDAQWTTTIGRFQRHNVKFDLNAGFRLTNRMSLLVQGRNILNEPRTQYDPNPGTNLPPVLQGMFNYGVSWVFGIKGNF